MSRVGTARLRHWVIGAGFALIFLIVASDSFEAWQDYHTQLNDNEREQQALDRVLSEQASRMVQEVDVVLSDFAEWAASTEGRTADQQTMRERLRAEVSRLPFVYSALSVGADGHVLATTQDGSNTRVSLATREVFTVPERAMNTALYIGQPFTGRRDGARTFALSRRIDGENGTFAGVVVARIAFEYLTGFYAGVSAMPDTRIRLVRNDGAVLVQYPSGSDLTVNDPYVRENFSASAQTNEHVRYWTSAGKEQVSALRMIEGYPIVVEVTRPLSSILKPWVHGEFVSAARTLTLVVLAGILMITLKTALLRHDRMESEQRRLAQELETTQKMEALGILAASVAHDFNNVLTAIVGYAELARKDVADESSRVESSRVKSSRVKSSLVDASSGDSDETAFGPPEPTNIDRLLDAAERARLLVRRVLTFNPHRSQHYVAVPLEPIVREVAQQFELTLPQSTTLRVNCLDADATVLGDATEIYQVAMNLCSNAVQAMPDGGRLEIRLETIEIADARSLTVGRLATGSWICLSVIDSGIGLTAEQTKSMFEPFYTTRLPGQGTGIGLTIVHRIVTRMHGALDVESRVGAGTRVSVYWPRLALGSELITASRSELQKSGRGETIMIVDDKAELVTLAEEVLASLGFEPVGFAGAQAALDAFRRSPRRFDAILTDERMQPLRGCDLATMIHKIDPTIPVILMTAYRDADIDARADKAGIREILEKPLHAETVSAALNRQLAGTKVTAPATASHTA